MTVCHKDISQNSFLDSLSTKAVAFNNSLQTLQSLSKVFVCSSSGRIEESTYVTVYLLYICFGFDSPGLLNELRLAFRLRLNVLSQPSHTNYTFFSGTWIICLFSLTVLADFSGVLSHYINRSVMSFLYLINIRLLIPIYIVLSLKQFVLYIYQQRHHSTSILHDTTFDHFTKNL